MNPKYQKVCAEIAKTEKKVEDLQGQLKELYDKKTELENLEIVNTVRAMVMDKDQIMAFLAAMKDGKAEMCCFDTSSRKRLIAEMKSLPINELDDEMAELLFHTVRKLEGITDEAFAQLYIAPDSMMDD